MNIEAMLAGFASALSLWFTVLLIGAAFSLARKFFR